MGLTFKTDGRLWCRISLVLFVVPWLLPILDVKGSMERPGVLIFDSFRVPLVHFASSATAPGVVIFDSFRDLFVHTGFSVTAIGIFSLVFGIPAIAIGWVLHCFVVIIRDGGKERAEYLARRAAFPAHWQKGNADWFKQVRPWPYS